MAIDPRAPAQRKEQTRDAQDERRSAEPQQPRKPKTDVQERRKGEHSSGEETLPPSDDDSFEI